MVMSFDRSLKVLVLMVAMTGCGAHSDGAPDTGVTDAAADATRDSQLPDGAPEPRDGSLPDASSDAEAHDASSSDASPVDARAADAGSDDAGSDDAGSDDASSDDASSDDAGDSTCTIGTAQSSATNGTLDLFGAVVYFSSGDPLPAGRYRATYLDGCMKYSSGQAWAVHAYAAPNLGWYLVGATSSERLAHLPGAVGYNVYPEFEDCVNASRAVAPVEFDHAGGPIGVWLYDSNYPDNVAGIDGRNPKWQLDLLNTSCAG